MNIICLDNNMCSIVESTVRSLRLLRPMHDEFRDFYNVIDRIKIIKDYSGRNLITIMSNSIYIGSGESISLISLSKTYIPLIRAIAFRLLRNRGFVSFVNISKIKSVNVTSYNCPSIRIYTYGYQEPFISLFPWVDSIN